RQGHRALESRTYRRNVRQAIADSGAPDQADRGCLTGGDLSGRCRGGDRGEASLHDDAWRGKAEFGDDDFLDAGAIPKTDQYPVRVSEPDQPEIGPMQSEAGSRAGVLLVNLGTPDAPTASAVKRYVREFLSDPRVVEVPRLVWWFILNLLILPFRSARSAAA